MSRRPNAVGAALYRAAMLPSVTDWIGSLSTFGTMVVAVVAAFYARRQWREARASREEAHAAEVERAQPDVGVYLEPSTVEPSAVQLVVRNFGPTAARDVEVSFETPLRRSGTEDAWTNLTVPRLPYLAPGQAWATWFDTGVSRSKSDLPKQYRGEVAYTGLNDQRRHAGVLLDWESLEERIYSKRATLNDVVQALGNMRR